MVLWTDDDIPTNRGSVERGHERYESETTVWMLLVAAWRRANRNNWFYCLWPMAAALLLACLWCGAPVLFRSIVSGW